MIFQEARHLHGVFTVSGHPQMKRFQPHVQKERILRRLDGAKIAHQLYRCLPYVRFLSEFFRIYDAVIGIIGFTQARELFRIKAPVKIAGVHNSAAYAHGMSVHVLGGGMGNDVRPPFKRIAVNGRGKGIVHNQRHLMGVGRLCKFFNVKHHQRGVGNGFRQHTSCIFLKSLAEGFIVRIRIHDSAGNSHFLHCYGDEVEGAAVNGGRKHHMAARLTDIEHRIIVSGLAGGCEHGRHAALQLADLLRNTVIGGVLEPGVKIAVLLQIEKASHLLGGIVFISGCLIDGKDPGFPVSGLPARLDTYCFFCVWFLHSYAPFRIYSSQL